MQEYFTDIDFLIIDEVSMLDLFLLNEINSRLMNIKNHTNIFGNITMLFVGDFCQFPPVPEGYSKAIYNRTMIESKDYDITLSHDKTNP